MSNTNTKYWIHLNLIVELCMVLKSNNIEMLSYTTEIIGSVLWYNPRILSEREKDNPPLARVDRDLEMQTWIAGSFHQT